MVISSNLINRYKQSDFKCSNTEDKFLKRNEVYRQKELLLDWIFYCVGYVKLEVERGRDGI